ncbi:MAG: GTPase ObgE [Holophagales bacterium]|nr:GTPase ObgE [Holophagales bacterium]MYC10077.1 GTPase ObgE [Holophagales bacterium]
MHFIDEAVIDVLAGSGGDGCLAFRREKFVPQGGPSGGDGGNGGDVVLVGSPGLGTLYRLSFPASYNAERGRHGEGSNKTGRSGRDLVIPVPLGTEVSDAATGEPLGEVLTESDQLVVARGGAGGRGNARFKSARQRAPRRVEAGRPGEQRRLRLELKLLADIGVVGLPNAGKSTLISRLTAAKPKIADYPFTTLVPQLGVVGPPALPVEAEPFVIADLPGLIAGAAQGAGLGTRFLRHVERCRVLLHLVDLGPQPEEGAGAVQGAFDTISAELGAFNEDLLRRPRVLCGSKLDIAEPDRRRDLAVLARREGAEAFEISAVAGTGLDRLVRELRRLLDAGDSAGDEVPAGAAPP